MDTPPERDPRGMGFSWFAFSQEIGIHHPSLARLGCGPHLLDPVGDLAEIAGNEDFVRSADIGAPIDVDAASVDRLERTIPVEHHDDIVDPVGQALCELTAGRDVNGLSDSVEGDLVRCRQGLDRSNTGDDLMIERHRAAFDQLIDDPQGAVVQRRITPDQDGAAPVIAELFADQPLVDLRPLLMPGAYGRFVKRCGVAPRVCRLDESIGPALDVALADLLAEADEVVLLQPLVHHDYDVDLIERIDGLDRDMVRIASADADDEDLSHGSVAVRVAQQSYHTAALLQPCSAGRSSALGSPGAVAPASSTSVTIRRPAPSSWQTIRPWSSI